MASDLSGYQGAGGKQRWMQESGGDEAAWNRENGAYQRSVQQAGAPEPEQDQDTPAAPGGGAPAAPSTYINSGRGGGQRDREGKLVGGGGQAEEGGNIDVYSDAADWTPGSSRSPTVQEFRKWAASQHAGYLSGDQTKQDEDYERWDDRTVDAWIKSPQFDAQKGGFVNPVDGRLGARPWEDVDLKTGKTKAERDQESYDRMGGFNGGGGDGGGGGGGSPAGPPPPPTTFGSQLSYTGNPLTDMLLHQFNTGSQLSDPSKMNTFALGEDRQEGGTGANADAGARTGQLLKGGGLWWQGGKEAGQDAFGGFRADQANANAANPLSMANTPAAPAAAKPAAPPAAAPSATTPQQPSFAPSQPTGMSGMLGSSFKPRESWRGKASGGADNPLAVQAF